VGLVLSGGGARALAHVGVIEELVAAGIAIDRVAGASMGAFVGALLASGMDPGEIDARCYEEWVRRNPLNDYRFPRHSLLQGAKVMAMLERNVPGLIEDLPLNFWCVSTDMIAAQLVVHRRGHLPTAVGASMCVPGIGAPVALGDRLLVDGGVLDNLPISRMADEREGPLIACDVTQPEQRSIAPGEALPVPSLMDTIMRLMLLGTTDTQAEARRYADLFIEPSHAGVGRTEFHLLDTMRDSGRRAAAAALEHAPPELWG
jgi:predicted acylesterase/phospholipase RssA